MVHLHIEHVVLAEKKGWRAITYVRHGMSHRYGVESEPVVAWALVRRSVPGGECKQTFEPMVLDEDGSRPVLAADVDEVAPPGRTLSYYRQRAADGWARRQARRDKENEPFVDALRRYLARPRAEADLTRVALVKHVAELDQWTSEDLPLGYRIDSIMRKLGYEPTRAYVGGAETTVYRIRAPVPAAGGTMLRRVV